MFNFISKALFAMVFVVAAGTAAPAMAGSLAIFDNLNAQNANVTVMNQETMDSTRAKNHYKMLLSPTGATYNFRDANSGRHVSTRKGYRSTGYAGITMTSSVIDYYTVGSQKLIEVNKSTGMVSGTYDSNRVLYIGVNGLGSLGNFTTIGGYGTYTGLRGTSTNYDIR